MSKKHFMAAAMRSEEDAGEENIHPNVLRAHDEDDDQGVQPGQTQQHGGLTTEDETDDDEHHSEHLLSGALPEVAEAAWTVEWLSVLRR